jgi:type IV secretion system protein VirB10
MKRTFLLIGLFTASACFAQDPPPNPPFAPASQAQTQGDAQKQSITIPAGTTIPVTLTIAIMAKTTHRGDPVRATIAFPVTIGTQLVIPAGTYVEGTVEKVAKQKSSGQPGLQIRFTQLVFVNGYSVPLDGTITDAKAEGLDMKSIDVSVSGDDMSPGVTLSALQFPGQGLPPLPPLPPLPKPKIGVAVGIAVGAAAAGIITVILLAHHRGSVDYALYDVGSQFNMVLTNPVVLDADRVAAAVYPAQ